MIPQILGKQRFLDERQICACGVFLTLRENMRNIVHVFDHSPNRTVQRTRDTDTPMTEDNHVAARRFWMRAQKNWRILTTRRNRVLELIKGIVITA